MKFTRKISKRSIKRREEKTISDLDGDIMLKLPEILEQLKVKARKCLNKRISAKTLLSVSQKNLEGIHLTIKYIKNKISKGIDASKKRIELKKQMGKYVEKATKFIAVINSQLNGCVVSMEDYYRGVFPWQSAYEISFQQNFSLIDAWMLAQRSKEDISQVKDEMIKFESGLNDSKQKLEAEFEKHIKSDNVLLRGKAFVMKQEIRGLSRILQDCDHWSSDLTRSIVGDEHDVSDSESSDDDKEEFNEQVKKDESEMTKKTRKSGEMCKVEFSLIF